MKEDDPSNFKSNSDTMLKKGSWVSFSPTKLTFKTKIAPFIKTCSNHILSYIKNFKSVEPTQLIVGSRLTEILEAHFRISNILIILSH